MRSRPFSSLRTRNVTSLAPPDVLGAIFSPADTSSLTPARVRITSFPFQDGSMAMTGSPLYINTSATLNLHPAGLHPSYLALGLNNRRRREFRIFGTVPR